MRTVSWPQLVALEPRLAALLGQALSIKVTAGARFCRHGAYLFGHGGIPGFKGRLNGLVGWGSPHDGVLGGCEAWEVALRAVLAALPPCHACGCVDADGYFV